jgi:hypothetical protein
MIVFIGGSMPKMQFLMNFEPSFTKTARHRVLKFCKNTVSYGVYKLSNAH